MNPLTTNRHSKVQALTHADGFPSRGVSFVERADSWPVRSRQGFLSSACGEARGKDAGVRAHARNRSRQQILGKNGPPSRQHLSFSFPYEPSGIDRVTSQKGGKGGFAVSGSCFLSGNA